jgi:hypothetical protein
MLNQTDILVLTNGSIAACRLVRSGTNFIFYRPDSASISGEGYILLNEVENIYLSDLRRADLLIKQNRKLKSIIRTIRPLSASPNPSTFVKDSAIRSKRLALDGALAKQASKPKRIVVVDETSF